MAIVKWNPINTVDSFFDNFFKSQFPVLQNKNLVAEGATMPSVNIKETDDEYALEIAAPGMEKDDFNVTIENGVLSISVEKETSEEKKEDNYTHKEFHYTSFQRFFNLPDSVDDKKIKAKYDNGILNLVLPKKAEAKPKPAKAIKVS
ncbi:MAG TPA: Hsp20/alpha crystallin family protein [Phaeodactylibacter sp.]|nr:Hsp20/alpha crystallin family protein [Phaeodactylibacter sp.]